MDKTSKKLITVEGIALILGFLATMICTIFQLDIIRKVGFAAAKNRELYHLFLTQVGHVSQRTVFPAYFFFCIFMSLGAFVALLVIYSKKKYRANPKACILPIVIYAVMIFAGVIYNSIGGDKLLYGPDAQGNITLLSYVMSFVVSIPMSIFGIFFLILIIRFIVMSSKAKRQAEMYGSPEVM